MKRFELRKIRREEAEARQAARDKRGDAGQIKRLVTTGHGCCREVARLKARIAAGREKKA